MPTYLQGFIDGYKKAVEVNNIPSVKLTMDGRELAEIIYKDVTELQERDRRIKGEFNAE